MAVQLPANDRAQPAKDSEPARVCLLLSGQGAGLTAPAWCPPGTKLSLKLGAGARRSPGGRRRPNQICGVLDSGFPKICRYGAANRIANAPAQVLGVMHLHGAIVPLCSTCATAWACRP